MFHEWVYEFMNKFDVMLASQMHSNMCYWRFIVVRFPPVVVGEVSTQSEVADLGPEDSGEARVDAPEDLYAQVPGLDEVTVL